MVHPAIGLVIAYLLGSIPAAYVAGRMVKGIDLRQHGSGNLGATNVYRLLGAKVAAAVLLFDAAKGALPVIFLPRLLDTGGNPLAWAIAYGVAAIAGHVRPIFLLWRGGGKGVATASGVFVALAPLPILISTVVFAVVFWAGGYVSLASLTAAAVLPAAVLALMGPESPVFALSALVAVFVFWTHRANIGRLRRGEESRVGRARVSARTRAGSRPVNSKPAGRPE
ncbi:MAG TPA: glycerol-3-phosphate 1-O-acyltransferase PlsY [Gemmatimonadales bacterium]